MKIYLVTGAAGFIGAKTSELLLSEGHIVVGVDNLNDYYNVGLKNYRLEKLSKFNNFIFRTSDIEHLDTLRELFSTFKFEAVINLAARAGVRASIENPFVYATTNIIGTLNLLELCKDFDIQKFVLASSSSLYAGEPTPFAETMPVNNPISQYAATKKSAEMLAYSYFHLYGIDVSVLRFFTVFGPAGRPDMSYYQFIRKIYNGEPITLFGDGSQTRDFTYIDDIADGVVKSLKKLNFEVLNLGGGKVPIAINEMISRIEDRLGKSAIIERREFHSADMTETGADITKANAILGWSPIVSFAEGINKTVDWFLSNPSAFEY